MVDIFVLCYYKFFLSFLKKTRNPGFQAIVSTFHLKCDNYIKNRSYMILIEGFDEVKSNQNRICIFILRFRAQD